MSQEIMPAEAIQWQAEERAFLWLDCREQDEYYFVHLEGCRFIPMSELVARAEELESEKETTIIVYCHHGVRSLRVAHWLAHQGFLRVYSLAGGIDRWSQEVDPSLPRY